MADQPDGRAERVASCLKAAEQAKQWAEDATTDALRQDYLRLATGWLVLANDIRNSIEKPFTRI